MSPDLQPSEMIAQHRERTPRPTWNGDWGDSACLPVLVVVMPLSIVDFSVVLLMDAIPQSAPASVIVYACLGLIPAQAALLTMALVFSTGVFWRRLLVYWVCVAALVGSWALGAFVSLQSYSGIIDSWLENVVRLFCSLPAVSLMVQLPLWVARWLRGWRFVRDAQTGSSENAKSISSADKLSIRDLFWATAIVGITLGIGRLASDPNDQASQRFNLWFGVAVFGAIAATIGTISILPLMWIFSRKSSLTVCWLLTLGYGFIFEALYLVLGFSGLVNMRLSQSELIGYTALTFCFAGGIASGLTLLRWNEVYVQRGQG